MPISHKNKLIFIHIPKNAGTAITDSDGINFELIGHHLPNFYISKFPNEWESYTKFAVVRNPWDRVVSNYEYAKMVESHWHSATGKSVHGIHPDFNQLSKLTFKETLQLLKSNPNALKHQGWGSQHQYVYNDGNMLLDEVFKLEELPTNDRFKELVPNLIYKNKSTKEHSSYRDYYDEEGINIVRDVYNDDITLFNYDF